MDVVLPMKDIHTTCEWCHYVETGSKNAEP